MTLFPTLAVLESDLRRATASHRFGEIERLLPAYCQAVAAEARALPAGDPRIGALSAHVEGLLEWTGTVLASTRAAYAEEMRRVPFLKDYLRRQPEDPHMQMDL